MGEKSHKNRRPSTLHSPSEQMKRTYCKVPGAAPDASGLIPLSHAVHCAKVRGQNSICGTCCARSEFQKITTGRRADFCSEHRPAGWQIRSGNITINQIYISIHILGACCCVAGGIGLLWLSQFHLPSAAFFEHFVSVFYVVDCCDHDISCCAFAIELKLSHTERMGIGRPPAYLYLSLAPCSGGSRGPPW